MGLDDLLTGRIYVWESSGRKRENANALSFMVKKEA
jgi:hypothetical protein